MWMRYYKAATLAVLLILFGWIPAHAISATPAAVDTTVVIPWGDWVTAALSWAAGFLVVAATAAKTLVPPIVRPFVSDAMISNAVHYALAKVNDAVAGQKLSVDVANQVIATAVRYAVTNEPKAAKALGDKLGPLIAAKLSQVGSAPSEPVEVPRVFGTPVK